jgi:hypothetical protein
MTINPADKANGVIAYTANVEKCIYCSRPANCKFDIGTPIPVTACSQEHAWAWWDKVITEQMGKEVEK